MTADERRQVARRLGDPPIDAEAAASSSRTAALVAALRSPEWLALDPDEVADHLLRLDIIRADAVRRLADQAGDWRVLVDDLEARLEASTARRAIAATELRTLAGHLDDEADLNPDLGVVAVDLRRIADHLTAGTLGTSTTAPGGEG